MRISSVLQSAHLPVEVTGVQDFDLNDLQINTPLEFELPENLRLGHVIERVVAGLLQQSGQYTLLNKNIQIKQGHITLGELDFLLREKATQTLIHLELAYKFYLYDPALNKTPLHHWIGPNRNDTLVEKLKKLQTKQFHLLRTAAAQAQLPDLRLETAQQQLCFLVHLFVPYSLKNNTYGYFQNGICGYYLRYENFLATISSPAEYYIPHKKEWGIPPSLSVSWEPFSRVQSNLTAAIQDQQSVLIWRKSGLQLEQLFVVWW